MNIQTIMEFILGYSLIDAPLYIQPVLYIFTITLGLLFFLFILKLVFLPFQLFFNGR